MKFQKQAYIPNRNWFSGFLMTYLPILLCNGKYWKLHSLGFTFAELLVAVSILAIVSFFSVGTYYQIEEHASLEEAKNQIQEVFRRLDDEIKNWKITSYHATFVQNQPGILIEIDTYGYKPIISINTFDWYTGSGEVIWNYTVSWAGYNVYSNTTSTQRGVFSGSISKDFFIIPFSDANWEIRWITEDRIWNGFRPLYLEYNKNIPDTQKTKFLSFSWSTATGWIISNIRWQKSYRVDSINSELFPVELTFERKWSSFPVFLK
jgi:prepilin-type N-terminal cleavage/methylation domain-containing protein